MERFVPNYRILKQLARSERVSIKDLIVLTPQNDPYYVGSPSQVRHADWMANEVNDYLRTRSTETFHDRAIHYVILSKGIERPIKANGWRSYEGDSNDFSFTMKAVQNARYLGLIPWSTVKDMKNPEPMIFAHYWNHEASIDMQLEYLVEKIVEDIYPLNPQLQQAYHVELWTKKATINDILTPIATRYGVNVQSFSGQATATRVYELMGRIRSAHKPVRILYISDYDRYGDNMPASCGRKLQWFVDHSDMDVDVKLDRIMLTPEQVDEYGLPSVSGEERKVELDALEVYHPGETERIIEAAVSRYIDLGITSEIRQMNIRIRRQMYESILHVLEPIRNQIESIQTPEIQIEDLPHATPIQEDEPSLYDSTRDYIEQTLMFKQYLAQRD